MRKRAAKLLKGAFSGAMGVLMVAMLLVALGYAAAFIVGMPASEKICAFLNENILSFAYISGILACIVGVIAMYLDGEKVFVLKLGGKSKKCNETEK